MRLSVLGLILALALPASAGDTVPIPPGTRSITFDGKRLRIAAFEDLEAFVDPRLYIPRGRHLVRWGDGQSMVKLSRAHHAAAYRKLRAELLGAAGGRDKLIALLARGFGVPDDASAPHLLGNWHWQQGDQEAATRWWRRAVLLNPAFAPSHVNLGLAALKAGDKGVATRELLLARAFNLGDGFGCEPAIAALAAEHELELTGGTTLKAEFYRPAKLEELAVVEQRMSRFYRGIGVHFGKREERAKLLSNLGLYLVGKGKAARARAAMTEALGELREAGRSQEAYAIATVIFENMARACDQSGWKGEAADFRAMAAAAKSLK